MMNSNFGITYYVVTDTCSDDTCGVSVLYVSTDYKKASDYALKEATNYHEEFKNSGVELITDDDNKSFRIVNDDFCIEIQIHEVHSEM